MVANGPLELASMDVVEALGVRPWLFKVVNFKAAVRRYPGSL